MSDITQSMQEKLLLNSLNCRGLADGRKRRAVFQWLKTYYNGIVLLQETHSTLLCEKQWLGEWGGDIFFSHGNYNARGVAILIPKNLQLKILNVYRDDEGRYVILDIEGDGWKMLLCNIYAPTKDKSSEQLDFFIKVFNFIKDLEDKNIVMGGDFNTCLDPQIDKSGGEVETKSKCAQLIQDYCNEINVSDVWRVINPDLKRFSRRGNTRKGTVQSRIDYWLISIHMTYDLQNTDIKPAIKTDHSIITLSFNIKDTQMRGRGFWKFNKALLKDKIYIEKINKCITELKEKYKDTEDKSLVWDTIKCELRSLTITTLAIKRKNLDLLKMQLNQK